MGKIVVASDKSWYGTGWAALVTQCISMEPVKNLCFYQRASTTSKLERISDLYKLICTSSQHAANNISASSSSSSTIFIHMNIHVHKKTQHCIATHSTAWLTPSQCNCRCRQQLKHSASHPIPAQCVCVFITNRGRQGMLPSSTVCLSSSSAAASHVDLSSPVRNKYSTLTTLKLLTSNCDTLATFLPTVNFQMNATFFKISNNHVCFGIATKHSPHPPRSARVSTSRCHNSSISESGTCSHPRG